MSGQTAMFANQANYSRIVGAQLYGQSQATPPLASPIFSTPISSDNLSGASVVGGLSGASVGAYTGLALAGGLGLARSAAILDPFTMAGRGLALGAGAPASSGFFGATAHMARAVAHGGLREGLPVLTRGAVGLGTSVAAPLAIGAAVHEGAGLVYEGAQNNAFMRTRSGAYFGPAYGSGQVIRPGGNFSPGQIRNFSAVLGEMASQDTILAMKDLQKLMDQFGSMGALNDITNAAQFKERFGKLVAQTKTIAEVMGTSLEEASQLFGSMRRMGVWRSSDVMGSALTATALGAGGAAALQQTMQAGAQGSFARGGNLSAGAFLAQRSLLDVSQAVRSGVLTDQDVVGLTGQSGIQGQQQLAQRLTQSLQNMSGSSIGRLAMAGLGEYANGRFTGRIDRDTLRDLQEGRLSMTQLQQRGTQRVATRSGAASFTAIQEVLGQNFASRGGLEVMSALRDSAIRRAGLDDSGEDVQQLFVQKLFGLDAREARFMEQMFANVDRIRSGSKSRIQEVMQDRLRSLDEQRNRTFTGLSQAIGAWYERTIEEPIKDIGRDLERDIQDITNSWTDYFRGRSFGDRFTTTNKERTRVTSLVQRGLTNLTMDPSLTQDTMRERFTRSNFFGLNISSMRAGEYGLRTLSDLGMQVDRAGYVAKGQFRAAEGDIRQGVFGASSEVASRFVGRLQQAGIRGVASLFDRDAMSADGTSYRDIRQSFEGQMTEILSDVQFSSSIHNLTDKERMSAMYRALNRSKEGQNLLRQVQQYTGAETEQEAYTILARESQIGVVRSPVLAAMSKIPTNILVGLRTSQGRSDLMEKGVTMMSSALGVDSDRLSEQLQNKEYGLDLAAWISNGAKSEDLKNFPALRKAWLGGENRDLNNIMAAVGSGNVARSKLSQGAEFFKTAKFAGLEENLAKEMTTALRSDASSLSRLSGLSQRTRSLVSSMAEDDLTTFGEMRSTLQDLIAHGKTLGDGEVRRLLSSSNELGVFLGQAGSLKNITQGSAAQVRARLKRVGLDVGDLLEGQDRAAFEQIFSDQRVTKGEASDLRSMLERFLESRRLGGARGESQRESRGEEFAAALTRYTEENTKFVRAVSAAVPQLKDVKVDGQNLTVATSDIWDWFG